MYFWWQRWLLSVLFAAVGDVLLVATMTSESLGAVDNVVVMTPKLRGTECVLFSGGNGDTEISEGGCTRLYV